MSTRVTTITEGTTARITLVTDGGLNVLSTSTLEQIHAAAAQVAADANLRFTIVTGDGKAFAAGADIKEMQGFDHNRARVFSELGHKAFDAIAALPSITIAAVNGPALGGGFELALACDFRLAVKTAKVGTPEAGLGLIPGWGGVRRSVALAGLARAKQLLFGANSIAADEAAAWGLIDELVNSVEDLGPRVQAFCKSLSRGGPAAIKAIKAVLAGTDDKLAFSACFGEPESAEGMRAFVEKRPARWME